MSIMFIFISFFSSLICIPYNCLCSDLSDITLDVNSIQYGTYTCSDVNTTTINADTIEISCSNVPGI